MHGLLSHAVKIPLLYMDQQDKIAGLSYSLHHSLVSTIITIIFMSNHIKFCLSFIVLLLIHQVQPAFGINVPFYLGWNRNAESDVAGYKIYIKDKDSDENFGSPVIIKHLASDAVIKYQVNEYLALANKTNYRLIPGHSYQIALSAFDHQNNESAKTDPPLELLIDEITSTTTSY